MSNPSLTTAQKYLYLTSPPELEKMTNDNLLKKLKDLINEGDEIVVTDPQLPISLRLIVHFTGDEQDPEFA